MLRVSRVLTSTCAGTHGGMPRYEQDVVEGQRSAQTGVERGLGGEFELRVGHLWIITPSVSSCSCQFKEPCGR